MQEPDIVKGATREYATDEDEVGEFLNEQCELGENFVTGGGELFAAFKKVVPNTAMTNHAFAARLRQKGLINRHPTTGKEIRTAQGKKGWKGVRMQSDPERDSKQVPNTTSAIPSKTQTGGKS